MTTQEPVDVSKGGMPRRVYEWLLKDFEEFFGPPPWSCDINDRFHTELGLLIRFSESLHDDAARKTRESCNSLSDSERTALMETAMEAIKQEDKK